MKERTAPYKYPREIEFLDELPKTISGKVKRAVLRTRELERKIILPLIKPDLSKKHGVVPPKAIIFL